MTTAEQVPGPDMRPMPAVTQVRRAMSPEQATELIGTEVPDRSPDLTTETIAADMHTGDPVFAYLPVGPVAELRRAVLGFDFNMTTDRTNGMVNVSRTFGYAPRRPVYGQEGCRDTRLWSENRQGHAVLISFAERLRDMLLEMFPHVAMSDTATMEQVNEEWKLGETTWTSGVINQSSALPYHRDAFNFPVWTAMPVLRRHCRGGYLHIPEYDVTVESRDGWAVFFPGYQLVHGVTPMHMTREDGYRYSVVYYALRGMKDCFTHAIETKYARQKRTERERGIADKLKQRDA